MLASLPKLADKAFVLGFLLPTLLFAFGILALFSDYGFVTNFLKSIETADLDKLVYFGLSAWLTSALMLMANHALVQVLEGYRWPLSKSKVLKGCEVRRFRALNRPFNVLWHDWSKAGDKFPRAKRKRFDELRSQLVREFPTNVRDLLPTRFGNAIRAFETYSNNMYGADSIPLWLHLSAVIPNDYQQQIADARAQVNFLVNICWFAMIVFVVAVVRFVWSMDLPSALAAYPSGVALKVLYQSTNYWFLVAALASAAISRAAYVFSVTQIYGWGDLVKAAFDCYLPALAATLGYELPESEGARREFWVAISRRAIYQRPINPKDWKEPKIVR